MDIEVNKKVCCDNVGLCDFTGKDIERGEILVGINSISLKITEYEAAKEFFNGNEEEMCNLSLSAGEDTCDNCYTEKIVNEIFYQREGENFEDEEEIVLCDDCCEEIIEKIDTNISEIEKGNLFKSDSGYVFFCDVSVMNESVKDILGDRSKISNSVIVGITSAKGLVTTDVENISKLIEIFTPEVGSSEKDRHEKECKMCHSEDSNPAYIKGTYACTECRWIIVNELEESIEKKNQEIISRII